MTAPVTDHTSPRLLPVPDAVSSPFWTAAAAHVLTVARCGRCQEFSHPPDTVCPRCHHTDPQFTFEAVSGDGAIRSWVVLRQSFIPGFEADIPLLLVDVELDAQSDLRMIGRLTDGLVAKLAVGDRVVVVFEDLSPDIAVPAFTLAHSAIARALTTVAPEP